MYRVEQYMSDWCGGRWMLISEYNQYSSAISCCGKAIEGYPRRITKLARDLSLYDIPMLKPVYEVTHINSDSGSIQVVYQLIDSFHVTYKPDDVVVLLHAFLPGFSP